MRDVRTYYGEEWLLVSDETYNLISLVSLWVDQVHHSSCKQAPSTVIQKAFLWKDFKIYSRKMLCSFLSNAMRDDSHWRKLLQLSEIHGEIRHKSALFQSAIHTVLSCIVASNCQQFEKTNVRTLDPLG